MIAVMQAVAYDNRGNRLISGAWFGLYEALTQGRLILHLSSPRYKAHHNCLPGPSQGALSAE
jgi:hypothetical protein